MNKCFGVFTTWDEEYDKFTGQLREMSRNKREETLKFAWRANPAHKKLQDRITRMRKYVLHSLFYEVSSQCVSVCVCLCTHMCVCACACACVCVRYKSATLPPYSFRKQHEQLQAVIVRVLRPQQQKGQAAQVGWFIHVQSCVCVVYISAFLLYIHTSLVSSSVC